MIRFARTVRLLPIVILAISGLFALKVSGLVFGGGGTLGERLAARGKPPGMTITTADSVPAYPKIVVADTRKEDQQRLSWAEAMFNYGNVNPDVTGSVPEPPKESKPTTGTKVAQKPPPTKIEQSGGAVSVAGGPGAIASAGEQAILVRLQQRREELDKRSRDLDMRESLLKAAEKRVEARVGELKNLESKVNTAVVTRDKAEAKRFDSLVKMYESMRAKDAARIFDNLDLGILVEVATKMKPRAMSEILAQMSSQAAERLTVELATRASAVKPQNPDQLPKIEGRPSGS